MVNGTVTVGAEKLIDLTIEPSEGGATDRAEAFKYITSNIVALVKDEGPKKLAVRQTHAKIHLQFQNSLLFFCSAISVDNSPAKLRATVNFLRRVRRTSLGFPGYLGARLWFTAYNGFSPPL